MLPTVSLAFIIPVINNVNAAKPDATMIPNLTGKKKKGNKGIKLPITALNPTINALFPGLLYSLGDIPSSSIIIVSSQIFLLLVILFTI